MTHGSTPAGWYDDGHGAQRWWDGNQWTDHTQPAQPAYGQPAGSSGSGRGKLYAIIAAVVAVVVIAAVLLVVLVSTSGGADGPEEAAEDFLKASADLDFEKACEFYAEDAKREVLESAAAEDCQDLADKSETLVTDDYKPYIEDLDIDVEIKDVSQDGDDKADVDFKVTTTYTGDDEDGFKEQFGADELSETNEDTLKMVKEDGDWLVAEDD